MRKFTGTVLHILAGTWQEARAYADRTGAKNWAFVYHPRRIRMHGPLSRVVRLGTWRDREDLAAIEAEIVKLGLLDDTLE